MPRPSIKLKVGGSTPAAAPSKPTPKPKGKKAAPPRELSPPPRPSTPVIDDGSADLLEEVIAIEREKNEERKHRSSHPAEKEKERRAPRLVIGKRKQPVEDPTEDEILALATPSKKERHTAPAPVPGPSSAPSAPATKPKQNGAAHSNGGTVQPTKTKSSKPPPPPEPPAETPQRSSAKGKEKEAVAPAVNVRATTPAKQKKVVVQVTPINEKKCKEVLKTLTKLPDARLFLKPVDPVMDGCPT